MALLKFGSIIVYGSGSLGGHTIQHSQGGIQIRRKPKPTGNPSTAQRLIRGYNKIMQEGWKALSRTNQLIWNQFAVNHNICNSKGDKHVLSGHSLWMKYQYKIVSLGLQCQIDPNLYPFYNPFITTWDSTKAGSAGNTIIIPTTGAGYYCCIEWGDGSFTNHVGTPGNITHVYSSAGIKTIKISGLFPRVYFNATGDRVKLMSIEQWGNIIWDSMLNAFYGCANLTGNYTDIPNTSAVINMQSMFRGCTLFNSAVNFDTSNVTDMSYMFRGPSAFNKSPSFNTGNVISMSNMFRNCASFNSPLSFNTAKVTDMSAMFSGCLIFNQDISGWNVQLVTTMSGMLSSCLVFSTLNYDKILNNITGWSSQPVKNTVTFGVNSTTKYTKAPSNAATGRAHLVLAVGGGGHGWTITDGGPTP
jgi:surface protein